MRAYKLNFENCEFRQLASKIMHGYGIGSRLAPAVESNGQFSHPNPEEFTSDNGRPSTREKSPDSYRRNSNRSPRKKVTVVVERREERDTESSIRHGIQQTVTCSCQKEICPHRQSANIRQSASKSQQLRLALV